MPTTTPPLWPRQPRASRFDVLGLGENSLDHVCVADSLPGRGAKGELFSYDQCAGGQVASALLGCARLGLRSAYVGAVGDDVEGQRALAPLAEQGVDLTGVRVRPGVRTRSALVLVCAADGERSVLARRDPALRLSPDELSSSALIGIGLLLLDATDPESACWAARKARAAGLPVVLDADRIWPGAERLLTNVDFPVVANDFAEEWGGGHSAQDGLARLVSLGARMAVATRAENGAIARVGGVSIESPAFPVEVVDTIGAGDAFHAGFAWALLQGFDAASVLRIANGVAALNCTAAGAQRGLPDRERLARFLEARTGRAPAGGLAAQPAHASDRRGPEHVRESR